MRLRGDITTYLKPQTFKIFVAYSYINAYSKAELAEIAINEYINKLSKHEKEHLLSIYDKMDDINKKRPRSNQ